MAEESDARIERLEKDSQKSRAQIAEMMELIRTLIKDKGQVSSLGPHNETAQPDQRREEPVYLAGFTPLIRSKCPHDTSTFNATSRKVPVRLCASPDAGERSGTKFRGKHGRPNSSSGP